MIVIAENIEDKAYHYKDWYKEMEKLLGTTFDTTTEFENTLSVGQKIHFDAEEPCLPKGMSIPTGSTITLDALRIKTLEVMEISQVGDTKTIKVGIRSTASKDDV